MFAFTTLAAGALRGDLERDRRLRGERGRRCRISGSSKGPRRASRIGSAGGIGLAALDADDAGCGPVLVEPDEGGDRLGALGTGSPAVAAALAFALARSRSRWFAIFCRIRSRRASSRSILRCQNARASSLMRISYAVWIHWERVLQCSSCRFLSGCHRTIIFR